MAEEIFLQAADYVVAILILLIPVGIGIYFAIKDSKNATRDEYLLGGRRMSMLPVALSLFVTSVSAIALVGIPSDVYHYGAMSATLFIGFSLSYVVGVFTMVPLMYPLHLTSLYEYLSLRFESQFIRMFAVTIGMLQTTCYMAIALLTPALGLQAAARIPLWMSVAIVGVVGTIYTAAGGIKSVVWTDAFQSFIMFGGMIAIIIKGSMAVGSGSDVISVARDGDRISFLEFSFDPRKRHTWWGTVIGGMAMWFTNIFNQSTIQRVCSMKTVKDANKSFLLNVPILIIFSGVLTMCGIVIYAYFFYLRCDPFEGGLIASRNQLTPYYVLHTLKDLPGMAGLFMATLFSGALSTTSSGINAMAAITVEDIFRKPLLKVKENTATLITKMLVCVYGLLIVGLAYAANSLKGPMTQIGLSLFGACGSPISGMFFLGASIPWANKYGASIGLFVALAFNIWMALGSQLYGKKDRILTTPSTDMCFSNLSSVTDNATSNLNLQTATQYSLINISSSLDNPLTEQEIDPYAYGFFIYDISYEWYGFIGITISFIVGAIASLCTARFVSSNPNPKLIFPFARKIWSLPEPIHVQSDDSNMEAVKNLKASNLKVEEFKHMELTLIVNGSNHETDLNNLTTLDKHS